MGWIVYSKDGQTERCVLHKLEYSGTFMGDRSVIATFSSEKKIDFNVFDYITYRGERFELELLPTVKKVSSREYKYELRFVSLKYELERCMMRNIVPGDNGIVYPTPLTVEFTGDVKYLAERIQACLDAMYGKGTWSITIAEGTESEEKNISMSNQNCWDALSIVNTEYKLNYFIKGRNVIIGGEEPVVDNVFEYGKGKGLYEIERISDTDTGVVTKLRAYGGTRNLDYSYPKLPEWKDSVLPTNYALSPLRLMLPSFKTDGKTDYVLASEEAIAKYGIRDGVITYDDIYPSITGMKNSEGQAIDEIKSVSAITSDTQPTFTVGLYDLGFDLSDSLTTDEAQLSMKSGSLQGYTFNITKIEKASDGSYTLTLGRNTLEEGDTGNFTVPNKDWSMKTGDKFVLLNILMPQEYIRDAENRLLARAKEYLAKYSSTNYSYNVGVDEIFMARNVNFYNDIMEGKRLTVNDQEIGINNENIIIQSLTIKEGEGIIPTFEVTLNNETTASTLDRIQGQISEVETSVNNNFSSQSELLKQYRKKLDKSVWDSIFVIHKNDPENPERITSVQSLVGLWTNEFLSSKGLNPGSGGGSGEGGATALYQLNDVAKNASETGVLGAGPGKVLTYGTDGKWYAADAIGLDETALGKYLTDNNYAKKSDIPSLSGYATESWVLGKNYITSDALSGYATQEWVNNQGYATASSLKVVSDKLNDFLTGTDTDGIINKWKELEAFLVGQTQTSTLAELLAVKADKATTLSGYGIADAYTKSEINSKLGGYVTTTALNTALAKKVDVAFLGKVFGFIGDNNSEVSINDTEAVITSIKAKFGLWTDEYLSSKGLNPNAGGGSGEGATALYQLNDVAQNANGTGVLGAEVGKVLTYGSDGKWYAAKAGMDEDTLSNYLTVNNYAKKSDIPSLDGYATQSWVNTALGNKVDKVSGMGLSQNNFTDALLKKLNGIAEGANKYILPVAKAAVLGGVMIGSTLNASTTGVLNLPEVMTAGTYAKVTTDIYGRVTAGSSLSASDIPALGISKITGLQDALDKKVNKSDFATEFDKAMQRWFVRDIANKGLHPADYDSEAVGIYSDSYVSSKGVNTGTGGGTGGASSLGELNNVGSWADEIPTVDRIMVQRKGATHWESLNLSDIGLNESQLADYLIANNYAKKSDIPSLSGYATQAWVTTQLGDYTTTTDLTALLGNKVDKVEGKGLSSNDFTDTLLNKLNGIEAGANKYVLPTASSSVLGGVKVGSTLAIANGVLNLKSGIATAGTYTKVTVDTYGRVTAGTTLVASDIPTLAISKISGLQTTLDGKANTDGSNATGTWGISITGSAGRLSQTGLTNENLNDFTYTDHGGKLYYAGGSNTTSNMPSGVEAYGLMVFRIAAGYTGQILYGTDRNIYQRHGNDTTWGSWYKILNSNNYSSVLDDRYVTKTFLARLFGAMDADGKEISVNNTSTVIDSIKAKVGLWTEQYLSSKGLNPNSGGGGSGSDYDRLDNWSDYDVSKAGYVLSAGLGWDLNTRVESLESKSITLTTTGTGNGLASFTQTGNSVVFTKANFLTSHQTIYGLTLQKNGTSLGTYTPNSAAKTINITVPTKVSELSNDSGFALKSYVDGNFPKLTEGLIPASYLPSYVDDVIEAASLSAFPKTGESGKIYVALDTNLTYRWSGTTYVEISPSLALGETSNTAYAGDKGKANATAIAALKAITISAGTGLSGGGNLTANRTISLKVATTEALGGIKVGNRLSIDANGVLSATYTYTLPTASATVLGGVKVGTTLNMASSGVLDIKAVGKAGTYFKVTTNAYGQITSGSNPTTLSGFGITDGFNTVAYSGSGNAITSATFSGHTLTLVKGTTFLTKAAFDDLFEKVNIGTTSAPVYAIKAKYGLYTEQFLSSMGLNTGTGGGGGGSDYDRLDTWTDYDVSKAGWVLSAGLGNDLNTRVTSLENGAAVTVTPSGTGAVVTGVTKAGTVITVTKGNLAFGSITGKPTTLAGYGITDAYTKTQADGKYVLKSGSAMTGTLDWTAATSGVWAIKLGTTHYIGYDGSTNSSMLHWTGTGTVLGSLNGTTTIRSKASDLYHSYDGTGYVILDARNYNSYAPTKTGGGASGTWGISITGSSRLLYFNQSAAVANTLMTGAGLYYNQVSSSTDTGYPSDYGHVIRLQRGVSTTLTSSQLVLDLFHQTGAAGLNQLYLRTGYGDGSKMVWGDFVQLLHTGNYTSLITKIGTTTVGGTAKGIYLSGGTPIAMSATVGSTTLPVYMSGGTITACSTTLGVSVTGYSKRLLETVLTDEDLNTYTYSSYSGRTFSGAGGNTVANKPSSLDSFGLLVLRSAGGYTTQLAYSGSDLYARYYNGTTWYAWTEFAHITDNVASATKLQTARTINGTSFNGTANITTANWGTARNIGIVNSDGTGTAIVTSVNGGAAVNLKLPATIKAALSGNATTATTLQTSRTLWGQSFNGSANVSGTLTGVESVVARSGRINNFLSYMDNSGNPAKGTICITLPNGWTSSMNTYEIWIYEYNTTSNASIITIGGYNYNGGGDASKAAWVNVGYHTKGAYNKGVRLGYNGSKCVILLGNTTTTWLYPKVYLKTICTGHSSQTLWGGTSTISLITSENGYTNIVTPARMDEFFGDTSVTGKLITTGAGHFGYNYTTMTGGVNVIGNSATNGFCLYDGSGTTARIYRISDVLYITRGGDNAKGLRMDTAGNIYPGGNNTLTNGKSDARWANMFSVLLNVSGAATFSSTVTATGTIASTAGYLKSTLNGNTVQIGSQNSSWAHFQSSVPFYFNTRINVNGHLYPHTNNAFTSGGTSNRWSNVFATAGNFSSYIDIGSIRISYDSANNALKVAKTDGTAAGLYAMGFLSSMGLATGTGSGGGGSDYDRLDSWSDYTADKAGYVLSAKLGNDLNTRLTSVAANYVTTNTPQTITAQKTWTVSQRMGNTSIYRSNNTTGNNATGSHWFTDTTYATIQFGIGVFTDKNVSPRAYIGWGANPWTVSSNLTVSSTQLTYKSNNILHAANYNDYAPTKTGTGASGTWGISISGGAAKLTTARTIWGQSFNGTANVSGALSGATTISASGIISTTAQTPGFLIKNGSDNKAAFGWRSTNGAYIYGYEADKYLAVSPGGYPVFGDTTGLMMPYTLRLFSKADYEYWVVLLWETTTQTTHRLTGKIYTNTTGGNRYQAADVALWYSKWSTAGDSSFLFNTYGQATPWNLVTCTYGGKTYYALQHINVQAVTAYFMGTNSNIAFTAVKYYTMAHGDVAAVVNDSEINGSIADVTTSVMSANGTPYALTSSNVASATKLATARTLWGQSFNGTANVSGSLTGVGNITASGAINIISTGANSISLKYNSADATSVILNGTQFKPFDAANGKLALGSTSARWNGVYSTTGSFSGAVTSSSTIQGTQLKSTVATGTAPLTVASTTVVTNLNADLLDGIQGNGYAREYRASYKPTGTAARWIRIGYFNYSAATRSWMGTFCITNSYSNNENTGLIFNVATRHTTTSATPVPNITQVSGNSNLFTSVRLVKDTSTAYANVYLEVYYNTTSANNTVYVSYKPSFQDGGLFTLYSSYTVGSLPADHTAIAQLTTTDGFATNQNIRAQGYLNISGNSTFNNRLIIQNDGKVVPYSTSTRRSGVYGVYDAAKIGHIWSMGAAYQISDDGATFGNLYGFAYKHTTNTTGGTMASGHQAVWCINGAPKVAMGDNFWVANAASVGGNLSVTGTASAATMTIKNTEAKAHLIFSRGNFNYITAPASGSIAFIVGGQAVGDTTCELIINSGYLYAGTTNATALGKSDRRWSNTYTQLLNVAGAATLSSTLAVTGVLTASSTLNVNGVLNANNATDATSTTAAGAVFDGGVGIAKQLRVGGVVTLSSSLVAPYTSGQWISLATRTNIIYGGQSQSETSAHGLFRVKTFGGNAVTFGGLKNETGFYGFTKAVIDAGTNNYSWRTIWDTATGNISTTGAISTGGSLNATGAINANSTTDSTSTTTGSIICDGGLGVAKQLRVGTTSTFTGKTTHNGGLASTTGTFSSTLSVTGVLTASTTVNIAGVLNANNTTDATSTTAASLVCDGGVGVVKQLRVGGATTLSSTLAVTGVASFNNATDATSTTAAGTKVAGGLGVAKQLRIGGATTLSSTLAVSGIVTFSNATDVTDEGANGAVKLSGSLASQKRIYAKIGMWSDGYMSSKGINDTSDMRLKNKVRDIFLPVKDIANAPAFEYTWKDGTPGAMVGSSAQYWQKVLSCSVREKKDGYLSMFYGHTAMVGLISLARHHENLEQRVARLEKEIKEKDKRILELERRISA